MITRLEPTGPPIDTVPYNSIPKLRVIKDKLQGYTGSADDVPGAAVMSELIQNADDAGATEVTLYLKLGLSPLDWETRWDVQPPDCWWGGKDMVSSQLDCWRKIVLPPHLSWDQSLIEGRAASTVYKATTSQERDARKAHARMWYAGIDWADQHHDAVVIDEAGRRVATLRVAHTAAGLTELTTFLRGIGDVAQHPEHVACLVETSHGLLISTLLEAGLPVYPVNPKTVDRHRKPAGAKTDAIDAYLLARTGRSDLADLRRLTPDSPLIAELKVLTRDQDTLIQSQTRLLNQLTACLKAYYPVALELFGKLHQPTTLAFLQTFPTLEQAQAASVAQLTAVLKTAGHPQAAAKAQQIWQHLQPPQLQADPVLTRAKARLMLALVAQLQPLLAQIAAYDEEITRLFLSHSDSRAFASLPRAGTRLAPRLLAEWGDDRGRYPDAASVQALGGTSPVAFQSGKFATVHRRYACSKPLRNALYQFAWQSTQKEPWAHAYYQRKRREGKSHSMAVRALANQWVRLIYALWVKHEAYDATIFLAAQQTHAPRAA